MRSCHGRLTRTTIDGVRSQLALELEALCYVLSYRLEVLGVEVVRSVPFVRFHSYHIADDEIVVSEHAAGRS